MLDHQADLADDPAAGRDEVGFDDVGHAAALIADSEDLLISPVFVLTLPIAWV